MKNSQKGFVIPLLITIITLLVLSGGAYIYTSTKVEAPSNISDAVSNTPAKTPSNLIGGNRDEHGCLGSAGYSWCAVKNKCLRVWEEKCEAVAVSTTTSMCKSDNDCKEISFPTAGGFFHEKCQSGKCIIPKDVIERGQVGNIPPGIICTTDAKQCSDGTYVGRTGPNCEFVCSSALINENASGYIKSVYTKNGKNYTGIDYIEFVAGGPNGVSVVNNNPKIRTFEISSDVKLFVNSFCVDKSKCTGEERQILTFDQFSNIFNIKDYSINNVTYLRYNPWDIIVKNGVVVEISEHFMP